jgi:carboxylate-amine ligase
MGVEEEFLLVDPDSGRPRPLAWAALEATEQPADDQIEDEMQLQQLETGTEPCQSLDELDKQLRACRGRAADSALAAGARLAALATSPLAVTGLPTPEARYQRIVRRFGLLAEDELTCGCHIHIGIESDEEGVAVIDRIRPWLAPLLALSANSPYWQGRDSSYASYRSQVWSRWPSAGPTELFGDPERYRQVIQAMTASDTVVDSDMVYFDARLSEHYPTVEIRVADVCLYAEDAGLLAVLSRALVETEARAWRAGRAMIPVRTELLRLAKWRAGRSGMAGELVDPGTGRPAPAASVLRGLYAHVRSALVDAGDDEAVSARLDLIARRGTGADAQRTAYRESGRLQDVVSDAVHWTAA